jgi:hypothetical protein
MKQNPIEKSNSKENRNKPLDPELRKVKDDWPEINKQQCKRLAKEDAYREGFHDAIAAISIKPNIIRDNWFGKSCAVC